MSTTDSTVNNSYKSWITLVEEAEKTLDALSQRSSLISISKNGEATGNCVIIFDTSKFSE